MKKEGEEVLHILELRFPCSPRCRPWWDSCVCAAPWGPCRSRYSPAGCGGDPFWSRWLHHRHLWHCGKATVKWAPVRHLWREEPTLQQIGWQNLWRCDPQWDPQWSSLFLKEWEGTHSERAAACGNDLLEKLVEDWLLWERPLEQREDSSLWRESRSRNNVWRTNCNAHSISPCTSGVKKGREFGIKLTLGRREGYGESVFRICFASHCPALILIGNKFNQFP